MGLYLKVQLGQSGVVRNQLPEMAVWPVQMARPADVIADGRLAIPVKAAGAGALLTLLQCLVGILLVSILPVRALSSGPMCRLIAPSDRAGPVNEEEIIDVASCRGGTEACSSP